MHTVTCLQCGHVMNVRPIDSVPARRFVRHCGECETTAQRRAFTDALFDRWSGVMARLAKS